MTRTELIYLYFCALHVIGHSAVNAAH